MREGRPWRPLLAAGWTAVLLAGCSTGPGNDLVCYPAGADGPSPRECVAAAAAAVRALGAEREPVLVAVHGFRGCPPGAFCGFRTEPGRVPLSALVGVRFADGTSVMGTVGDVSARPLAAELVMGYDPDDFIDGVARSRGTLWP